MKVDNKRRHPLVDWDGKHVGSPLADWYGLSYASFTVLPRVLMENMPLGWQEKMAALLAEYEKEYDQQPMMGASVRATDSHGKLVPWPTWLLDYKYPDHAEINQLRDGSI